jgi:hypothetical protein
MEASIAAVIVAMMVLLDMDNSLESGLGRGTALRSYQFAAGFLVGRNTASAMARRKIAS